MCQFIVHYGHRQGFRLPMLNEHALHPLCT
jgi:hypothetical protein